MATAEPRYRTPKKLTTQQWLIVAGGLALILGGSYLYTKKLA